MSYKKLATQNSNLWSNFKLDVKMPISVQCAVENWSKNGKKYTPLVKISHPVGIKLQKTQIWRYIVDSAHLQ